MHDFRARNDIHMRFIDDTLTGGFNVAPVRQLRDVGVFGATLYGDPGKQFRVFADFSAQVSQPMTGVIFSFGLGRTW